MSIFGKLFKKNANPAVNDPVFGRIEFRPCHGLDMWCHIPSVTGEHMIIVSAPLNGPTQAQREFYSALRACIAVREADCKAFVAKQDDPPANLSNMTIYSVEVGSETDITAGRFVIEISDPDAMQIHRVEFKDGQPARYGADD
jgi:hypothetical protein